MSMQKVLVSVPLFRGEPRGAVWAAQTVSWLQALAVEVRTAVATATDASRRRAQAVRQARNRAAVIALAMRYQGTQPEFAKDLFAAATNHRAD